MLKFLCSPASAETERRKDERNSGHFECRRDYNSRFFAEGCDFMDKDGEFVEMATESRVGEEDEEQQQ